MSTENLDAVSANENFQTVNPETAGNTPPENNNATPEVKEEHEEKSQDGEEKKPDEKSEKQPEDEHKHKGDGWQKRVNKLTAKNKQLEARIAEQDKVIQQLIPKDDEGKPTIEYNRQPDQHVQQAELDVKIAEAKETYSDYDQVEKGLEKIPRIPILETAIVESDLSGHILYELGKNPSLALPLINASEREANRFIGRLEAQIESRLNQPVPPKPPAPKPVTNAPEPIKPVSSGSAKTEFDHLKHPEKYTADEWRRLERERVEKLHKR